MTREALGLHRRVAMLAGASLLAAPRVARAQAPWPAQPVRYINTFPPGGSTDTLSRMFCARMAEITGQQFIVENRAGSGGVVGAEVIARAVPDGYTLGLGGIATHAIAPTLYARLPFNPVTDFTSISGIWQLPNLLGIHPSLEATTVAELIALLRANPGRYSYGSAGSGTTLHLSGEMFKQLASVDMLHVPYRGAAPAYPDLIAGRIHMMFDNIPGMLALFRANQVRAIAVTSAVRSPVVPDIPAIADTLPGFDITSWTSLSGPAGIAAPIVARISAFARQALESEALKRAYLEHAAVAWWTTPADLAAHRAREEARLAPLIRASGARVE